MNVLAYRSRFELLAELSQGKNVLHLGAVGETCSDTETRIARAGCSLHALITRSAAQCVGVDYDRPSVEGLTKRGVFTNLICADVTHLTRADVQLEPVELIVAGDVLEHLSNPGGMLEAMRRLAEDKTRLVVTVPNALGLPVFLRHTLGKRRLEGTDHVCSFNICTLTNLLDRHQWAPVAYYTCHQPRAERARLFRPGRALFQLFPRWGGTLLVIAEPKR